MFRPSRKTLRNAAIATALSVVVSVSIVLLVVPLLGGHPDGPGFWMSVVCPLVIAGPASAWQFHQKDTIVRQRDELHFVHRRLEAAHEELRQLHVELTEKARTDSLTGGLNREAFLSVVDQAAKGTDGPLALLVVDADHFKQINDRFGHLVGDEALRRLGGSIDGVVGERGAWGRVGGEEFAIFLANTDRDGVIVMADRIRRSVAGVELLADEMRVPLTVSIGAASAKGAFDPTLLYRRADEDLFRAKNAGRNRVVVDGEEVGLSAA